MRSSIPLYNALAAHYEEHFQAPHRRAYDDLAWEFVKPLLPAVPGRVVDAGCGVGRWTHQLLDMGHNVVGIEQAPGMAAVARSRLHTHLQTGRFALVEGSMEEIELPEGEVDLVLALGSLQYTLDPGRTIERFARWTKTGGWVVVLVDSLVALVLELLAAGKEDEALLRLATRMGTWSQDGQQADQHLLDRESVENAFRNAGLTTVRSRGLLVGIAALGRERLIAQLKDNWQDQMALERKLAESPLLADVGKQLLVTGHRDF